MFILLMNNDIIMIVTILGIDLFQISPPLHGRFLTKEIKAKWAAAEAQSC